MASKVEEDSSGNQQTTLQVLLASHFPVSDDQQTARHLLRPRRIKFLDRLTSSTIKGLAAKLYELHVISQDDMKRIESDRTGREGMARRLMSVMEMRQCVQFLLLLQETEGIQDVATNLLEIASGVPDRRSLDYEYLLRENSKLREENETIRTACESVLRQNSLMKKSVKALAGALKGAGKHKMMETAMQCKPQEVEEGVCYKDKQVK